MPFRYKNRSLNLDDFEPDGEHDSLMDLIEVICGEDKLYIISVTKGLWTVDGAMMPRTITTEYAAQKRTHPSAAGVEVDEAEVGKPLLLSLVGVDWVGMWRSVNPVTDLRPAQRHHSLEPSRYFPIEKNL